MTDGHESNTVFVVHGRNERMREALFQFLKALGLRPVKLSEVQTDRGSTHVLDALNIAFEQATAVVVLMTGDEEGRLRPEYVFGPEDRSDLDLKQQTRLNVVFEAGLAFARHRDRTVLITVGDLRGFSDMAGMLSVRLRDGSAAEQRELACRLKDAKCDLSDGWEIIVEQSYLAEALMANEEVSDDRVLCEISRSGSVPRSSDRTKRAIALLVTEHGCGTAYRVSRKRFATCASLVRKRYEHVALYLDQRLVAARVTDIDEASDCALLEVSSEEADALPLAFATSRGSTSGLGFRANEFLQSHPFAAQLFSGEPTPERRMRRSGASRGPTTSLDLRGAPLLASGVVVAHLPSLSQVGSDLVAATRSSAVIRLLKRDWMNAIGPVTAGEGTAPVRLRSDHGTWLRASEATGRRLVARDTGEVLTLSPGALRGSVRLHDASGRFVRAHSASNAVTIDGDGRDSVAFPWDSWWILLFESRLAFESCARQHMFLSINRDNGEANLQPELSTWESFEPNW